MSVQSWLVIAGCLVAGYLFTGRIIASRDDVGPGEEPSHGDADRTGGDSGADRTGNTGSADVSLSVRTCYDILQVPSGARAEEIRLAYKRRISENHPDKVSGMSEAIRLAAETESRRINQAYDYLRQRGYV